MSVRVLVIPIVDQGVERVAMVTMDKLVIMWIITSGEDVGGGLGDINWWSRCWKNGSEERKKEVSLVRVTCRAGSNAANSRQSCNQRTASLRRDRAWSGEDGYQNVEPVKVLMDIMILDLTSSQSHHFAPMFCCRCGLRLYRGSVLKTNSYFYWTQVRS